MTKKVCLFFCNYKIEQENKTQSNWKWADFGLTDGETSLFNKLPSDSDHESSFSVVTVVSLAVVSALTPSLSCFP